MDSAISALAGGSSGFGGAAGNGGRQGNGYLSSLPLNGAGAEGPTESVSVSGAQGRTQDFGGGNEEELQQRIQEFRDRMQREGGGFPGGGGGGGLGGTGGALGLNGRRAKRFNPHAAHSVRYVLGDKPRLDIQPAL